jgi:hypothetical protein
MGKLIIKGWSKPGDEIAQPTGVIMGRNLRKPRQPSEAEVLITDFTEYCAAQKAGRVGGAHLRRIHKRTTET